MSFQKPVELLTPEERTTGFICESISMPQSKYPQYVLDRRGAYLSQTEAVIGLRIRSTDSEKTLVYMPGVASIDATIHEIISHADVVLFDGTFWTNEELKAYDPVAKTALEIGHIPLSGPAGVLELLKDATKPKKFFTHINNTNPILNESSEPYRIVRESGWDTAFDGMEIQL